MSDGDATLAALTDRQRLPLLYHTARNMRARQLAGVAERKLRHLLVPRLPIDFDARYDRSRPSVPPADTAPIAANTAVLRAQLPVAARARFRERACDLTAGEVTFRNRTVTVEDGPGVDWVGTGVPAPTTLWGLQFHGFVFLGGLILGYGGPTDCPSAAATAERWIRDWDDADATRIGGPAYLRRSWTPHAVSLRIMHWIRYHGWAGDELDARTSRVLRRLVAKNATFLANHVEHDVGGNHLIENGAALAMAGLFLPEDGGAWLDRGLDVLAGAADQFLDDGGHFERSPMYHAVTATRYLTVLDLLDRRDRDAPAAIRDVAVAGSRFLATIAPPDGRLPLLNDSAFGYALPLESCLDYARAVGVSGLSEPALATDDGSGLPGDATIRQALEASGYYWLGDGRDRLLVDGGAIGPHHLPAHSHNDHFAVLWWADGRRVLTDTGVFEYLPTRERDHARSVRAHNTVQYADVEPIPTGGSYLFGRRIEPTVRYGADNGVTYFDGFYRRRARSGPQYTHRRRIFAVEDWWLVWDAVSADEAAAARSRLHFAPTVSLRSTCDGDQRRLDIIDGSARPSGSNTPDRRSVLGYVYPIDATRVTREERPYYPEFGRKVSRPAVTLRTDGPDASFGFLLSRTRFDDVDVTRDGDRVAELRVDETHWSLPEPDG
jgi:hypothetical protein